MRATFLLPAYFGNGEFRLGQIFAGVVGVHHSLQREPRPFVASLFDIVDGGVEENFIGLLRIFRNRVLVLVGTA